MVGTSDGQKLNEKWQKLADCRVKQGILKWEQVYLLWSDEDEINKADERIVAMELVLHSLNDNISAEEVDCRA